VITAIVLIKTSVDRIPEIAETIAALDGVSEVYSVTGTYDLVAMVRVKAHDELAEVIPGQVNKVPGEHGDAHRLPHLLPARPGRGLRHRPGRVAPNE
jgi:DNA-binding Lrp family transcriptional regulator